MMIESDKHFDILKLWNIGMVSGIDGSKLLSKYSNKSFRRIIRDGSENRYILESVPSDKLSEQESRQIFLDLVIGADPGLEIVTYLKNAAGNYFEDNAGSYLGVVPFVEGIPLDQMSYLDEAWRGIAAANFLIRLSGAAEKIPMENIGIFSVKDFVNDLILKMERHSPEEYLGIKPVFEYLEKDFFLSYDRLPIGFCHGDFHMFNMVWGRKDLLAVLDWEFSSRCAELYDAAFMAGCLGMEDPDYLKKDIVTKTIKELQVSGRYSRISWKYYFDLFLSIRMIWLSQWLKFSDKAMIGMEIEYIKLVFSSKDELLRIWDIQDEICLIK